MDLKEVEWSKQKRNRKELVGEMGKQINHTFLLVESLLDWFHNQLGGMLFNPVARDLGSVVQVVIDLMQVKIKSKHIDVHSDIADNIYVFR